MPGIRFVSRVSIGALAVGMGLTAMAILRPSARTVAAPQPVNLDALASDPVGSVAILPEGRTNPAEARGDAAIARGTMRAVDVRFDDDILHVEAAATLLDKRPGLGFVWSVRVLDPAQGEAVVFDRRYDTQLFWMTAGELYEPTFRDDLRVPLGPGEYVVEIGLYRVSRQGGLRDLDDAARAKRLRASMVGVPLNVSR